MGILKFTTLFKPDYVICKDQITDEIIAIDAMSEIYRIILGFETVPFMKKIRTENIEEKDENSSIINISEDKKKSNTLWIKTLIDILLSYKKHNLNPDYSLLRLGLFIRSRPVYRLLIFARCCKECKYIILLKDGLCLSHLHRKLFFV